jgi:hypothetical protein
MIREELDDNNSELQVPIQSLLGQAPGAPVYYQSSTSVRQGQDEDERTRPSSGKKMSQY